jgi:hypothetical protein
MNLSELIRVKILEQENARLKRIAANQAVDIDILKDINSKKEKPNRPTYNHSIQHVLKVHKLRPNYLGYLLMLLA